MEPRRGFTLWDLLTAIAGACPPCAAFQEAGRLNFAPGWRVACGIVGVLAGAGSFCFIRLATSRLAAILVRSGAEAAAISDLRIRFYIALLNGLTAAWCLASVALGSWLAIAFGRWFSR
jgi:hypothetical protein